MSKSYLVAALEVVVEVEDALAQTLFELGCIGIQPRGGLLEPSGLAQQSSAAATEDLGRVSSSPGARSVEAFFELPDEPLQQASLRNDVADRVKRFAGAARHAEIKRFFVQEERDWLAEYRRRATPIEIGNFVFDPQETAVSLQPPPTDLRGGSRRILLPASQAFGTGSHETTRLMVEMLQDVAVEGRRVLDVGSGSAILGLVCESLGSRVVVALEIDLVSNFVAQRNLKRNGARRVCLLTGTIDCMKSTSGTGEFDVVLVNVLPHRIAGQEARIAAKLRPGGLLLLSGILTEQRDAVLGQWRSLSCKPREPHAERRCGEWSGWILEAVGNR